MSRLHYPSRSRHDDRHDDHHNDQDDVEVEIHTASSESRLATNTSGSRDRSLRLTSSMRSVMAVAGGSDDRILMKNVPFHFIETSPSPRCCGDDYNAEHDHGNSGSILSALPSGAKSAPELNNTSGSLGVLVTPSQRNRASSERMTSKIAQPSRVPSFYNDDNDEYCNAAPGGCKATVTPTKASPLTLRRRYSPPRQRDIISSSVLPLTQRQKHDHFASSSFPQVPLSTTSCMNNDKKKMSYNGYRSKPKGCSCVVGGGQTLFHQHQQRGREVATRKQPCPQPSCLPPSPLIPPRRTTSTRIHPVEKKWYRPLVEIHPGYKVPLIGSDETWHAYCQNAAIGVKCCACQTDLYCVASSTLVLCPNCRMISPAATTTNDDDFAALGGSNSALISSSSAAEKVDIKTDSLGLGLSLQYAVEEMERRREREAQHRSDSGKSVG